MANVYGRLSTDTKDLATLCHEIETGEIKVPQFQRKYIWNDDQALELLDSIANSYPVGSLLLWKTKDKMRVERNIGDFSLPETDDVEPTDYVLDGQQRLTVIYSSLGASEGGPGFAAAYDLENEQFLRLPEAPQVSVFPLRRLFQTTRLLDFRTALLTHPNSKVLHDRFDKLVGTLTNYKIPIVTLKGLTVEEVCPIFERINSSGTRLSTYDLLVAATWSDSFDLNEQAERIQAALEPKGFGDIEGKTILKCMAAIIFKSIKRGQILKLRNLSKEAMDNLVSATKDALLKSVDLLSTEFLVYSWDFVPYEAFVIVLSYLYSQLKTLDSQQVVRVRQWFWRSAFSERYRGASESFVTQDLSSVRDFMSGLLQSGLFGVPPAVEVWKSTVFRSDNSRSRAFVLALAAHKPKNLTNGSVIDIAQALSIYNQKEFHHVHPRAHLKRTSAKEEHNAIANICMLAAAENKLVSDQTPQTYLPKYVLSLGSEAESVFRSNLLPSPKSHPYATADYAEFLDARAPQIAEAVQRLCDGLRD